jgi:hypothetical protein
MSQQLNKKTAEKREIISRDSGFRAEIKHNT